MPTSNPAAHAQHDLELIAGHAVGDLSHSERQRADALLQTCPSCADLRRDLIAIAAATRALPPIASAPRDFRLDPARAARLRRGGLLRSLLGPFAAPRSAVRPVATAFTTLGLAGLLVTTILPGLAGSAGALVGGPAAAPASLDMRAPSVPEATAATEQNPVPVALPAASGDSRLNAFSGGATAGPDRIVTKDSAATTPPDVAGGPYRGQPTERQATTGLSSSPPNPVLVGSVALLTIGLALFALRFVARRAR